MTRHFDTAMIRLEGIDSSKYKEACKSLKYFEIDGKPCRSLPFDKEILGSNKYKLLEKNVFVKSIPKNKKPEDLEKFFSDFGTVKSAKLSLNSNHESNGYGFVCFES
jgi:RNA recognition motif-containing protein